MTDAEERERLRDTLAELVTRIAVERWEALGRPPHRHPRAWLMAHSATWGKRFAQAAIAAKKASPDSIDHVLVVREAMACAFEAWASQP